jgi:hypothetical protein
MKLKDTVKFGGTGDERTIHTLEIIPGIELLLVRSSFQGVPVEIYYSLSLKKTNRGDRHDFMAVSEEQYNAILDSCKGQ